MARTRVKRLARTGPVVESRGFRAESALRPPHALRPADVLALQRTVGNQAVQRLIMAEGKNLAGEVLEPHSVRGGVPDPRNNLKWNRGGGASGQGKYNTGFWHVRSNRQLELHVHMGNKGGLVGSGSAHHFKIGQQQVGSLSSPEVETIFGNNNVTTWTKSEYAIPG